ncbi:MAG: hypothetical protein OJF61_002704 [Rhodanobacteraceae bacterium]|jgi:hypothetical protein|nr:MAG: hypothetical protein OJF61_002704 [Rhodanobacteraceae bacterium]
MFSFAASRECQMGPTLGMDFACMLVVRERGASRVQQPGYSFSRRFIRLVGREEPPL